MRRGRWNNLQASPAASGPLPFGAFLVKMESQTAPQKTFPKSIRHMDAKFAAKATLSEPGRDFDAFWVPKGTPNGCRNGEKSNAGDSVVFATLPIRNPWFQLPGHR